jgi:hypothetical protein
MGIGVNGSKRDRPSFVAGRRARPAAAPVVRYVALAALGLIAGAGGVALGSLLVPEHKTDSQYTAPIASNDELRHTARANAPAEKAADDAPAAQRAAGAAPDEPRNDAQPAHRVAQERAAEPTGQDQNSATLGVDKAPREEPSGATGALRKNGSGEASPSQTENREQAASGAHDEKSDNAAEAPSRSTAALGDKPSEAEKLPPLAAPVDQPPHRTGTAHEQAAPEVKSRQASRSLTVEEPPLQAQPSKRPNTQRSLRRGKARATLWHSPARTARDARRRRLAIEDRAPPRRLRPRVIEEVVIIGPEAARVYHVIVPRYPRAR